MNEMRSFFNKVADGYDEHMRKVIIDYEEYYNRLTSPIKETDEPIKIINLGCGTGPELEHIFKKCPNAQVVCVDVAENMLNILKDKYACKEKQITLIADSYENVKVEDNTFDYVICAMCLHHYDKKRKNNIFNRFKSMLKEDGLYIEGDFVVTPEEEEKYYEEYQQLIITNPEVITGNYHIDVPATVYTETTYLINVGFKQVDVLYKEGNKAIFIGTK